MRKAGGRLAKMLGREAEFLAATASLDSIADGPSATIITGEPGIGKSTLWRHALEAAAERGFEVLSSRPVESETKLSYATLADLISSVAARVLPELPTPQREALEVLLLMRAPGRTRPDQRLISMAVLSTFDVLADSAPLLIAIDDVRWVDQSSARVLRFVFRRLARRPVGILLSARTGEVDDVPLGLDEALDRNDICRVVLGPLTVGALYHALVTGLGLSLPRPVLLRVHEASGGNPLLGLEITRALKEGAPVRPGEPLPVPVSLAKLVDARIRALRAATRRSLLAASAVNAPTVALVLEVTGAASWDDAGGPDAEAAGVIEVEDGQIRFCHPVLASAAYAAATADERRAVHGRLAGLRDQPEEHANHLGLAATGPDEAVAEALAVGARSAWERGAPERAAELAELAVRLTPQPSRSAYQRCVDAAGYLVEAGDPARAEALLEHAVATEPTARARAETLCRLGQVHHRLDDHHAAVEVFGRALKEADLGAVLRAAIERDLALATVMQGDLPGAAVHARTAVELARHTGDPVLIGATSTTLLLTEFLLGGHRADQVAERLSPGREATSDEPLSFRRQPVVASLLKWTDDLEAARSQFDEEYQWARGRRADSHLPTLLWQMSDLERLRGNWTLAAQHAEEAVETALLTSNDYMLSVALSVRGRMSACLGRVDDSRQDLEEGLGIAMKVGAPLGVIRNRAALGFLELSLGNPEMAHEHLGPLTEMTEKMGMAEPALLGHVPDDIEALVGLGLLAEAEALLDWYRERAVAAQRTSALAAANRCHAILLASAGRFPEALGALAEARKAHETLGLPLQLGRTLLATGRVLRRAKEKRAAKDALEEARRVLEGLPAPLWLARVAEELGRLRPLSASSEGLTATEAQVARLAGAGRTNREIANELFIGTKSVEAHLSRIYAKLGIRSRVELSAALRTPPTYAEE